ncbi:MAG: hypothetical protein ACOC0V_03155, partial [Oceanicaulis sp.]
RDAEPRTVLQRFDRLEPVRRSQGILRHRVDRGVLLGWAVEGLEPPDIDQIAQITDELRSHSGGTASGRARLAHLIHVSEREDANLDAVTALASVITEQTAAIMAATTAATVAATSSS